jgi:tetratricopeptide (TPR) repeat protein
MGRELAASYSRVGDLLSATGNTSAALDHRRTSLALMQPLARKAPDDPAIQRQLGVAHQKLAQTLGNPNAPNIGDFNGAYQHLQEAASVFRSAGEAHPTNTMFRRNLAIVQSNMADVLLALNRPREALASIRQSQDTFEALVAADPVNASARSDAAIGRSKVGEMLDANGRTTEALVEYERALAIHQSLAAADPANEALKAEMASDFNRVATAQTKLEMRIPALSHHTRAIDISRELAAANPGDVELQVALAMALTGRGDAYASFARRHQVSPPRVDDLTAAARDYREALALFTGLREKGAIEGTDVKLLENARDELRRIEGELVRAKPSN